ncbi:MAG: hypothetical protein KKF44_01180 [Nanoarchaeota archaeon]|nr:hypothetical protein [Nanoarchaeota archaeon]
MAKQDKIKATRGKKKHWLPIHAPEMFESKVVGNTYQYESADAVGTTIQINLMNLTNNIKNQNVNVKFLITDVKEGRLYSKVIQYSVISSSIKRAIRRRHNKLDDSLGLMTKDNVKIRIKPLIITRNKAKGSVKTALRAKTNELVEEFVKNNTYDDIFKDTIFHKVQRSMKDQLNKIYPIKECAIRIVKHDKSVNELKKELVISLDVPGNEKKEIVTIEKEETVQEEKPKKEQKEAPAEKKEEKKDNKGE